MSREDDRRPMPELVAELIMSLQALLDRAADEALPGATVEPDRERPSTSWQKYANELRDLCRRVLDEADEETAVAFWLFFLEMAARHGRRACGWPA